MSRAPPPARSPERQNHALSPARPTPSARASSTCRKSGRNRSIIALPIAQNISLPRLSSSTPNGVLNDAREWRLADEYASPAGKAFSWRRQVEPSGSNQQK